MTETSIKICTLKDFFREIAQTDGKNLEDLVERIDPKIFDCRVHIVGDGYDGTIPGQLLQGLSDFQSELFRTFAFAETGKEDLRGLCKDDLYISIQANKGSLELILALLSISAVAKMFSEMTPSQKWATIFLIFICFSTHEYNDYLKSKSASDTEIKRIEATTQTSLHREQTEQKRIELNKERINSEKETAQKAIAALERIALENARGSDILNCMQHNSDKASDSIVRNAAKAKNITIRQKLLKEDEIKAIQSPESQPVKRYPLQGQFIIVQINTENPEIWKLQLKNKKGEKIPASALVFNLFFDLEKSKELLDYQKDETLLDIELGVTEKSYGTFYEITRISIAKDQKDK